MAGSSLPERVAQIYYTYGLFCSSYPFVTITLSLSVVLMCCFPLLNVPLPGNIPTVVTVPLHDSSTTYYKEAVHKNVECNNSDCQDEVSLRLDRLYNETQKLPYIWSKDKPLLYIQQIILKTGVSPWNSNLRMWDAFRAPLQEVFRLLETIRNHEDPDTKTTLSSQCYHVDSVKRSGKPGELVMPEYNCLVLSPANLWQQNLQAFSLDTNIISTIYNHQNLHKAKVSLAEMMFGMQLRDAGVKRYPLRARPRLLQYSVTVFYQHADKGYLNSLTNKLKSIYPLHQDADYSYTNEATLIYYPGEFNYHELVPLTITFIGLFLYVYFSVRKIEFIKSKLGLAASAVLTIAGSLSMSMGICFYFGFSLSLQGKEIFPYLVIIVGLENVLVLTKSVTSTDTRLDVKIRLAQGLSKEGWSITKNFLTEITVFTVSFFTFVPFIQEFSIFMIVSLISDYFIQMAFFATILGVDVRRMEYFQEQNTKLHLKEYFNANNAFSWRFNRSYFDSNSEIPHGMTKSKSHPRLNGLSQSSPTDVVAKRNSSPKHQDSRVPKRIRLVNFWARTRFFQRAFMIWMIVWISMIVYNSGVVDYFVGNDKGDYKEKNRKMEEKITKSQSVDEFYKNSETIVFSPLLDVPVDNVAQGNNETMMLKHSAHARPWSRLSPYHWSSILSQYNASVAGRYVINLPPVLLSYRVSPELAVGVRNPDEKEPASLRWQALAVALDPIDILPDFDLTESKSSYQRGKATELPIYPTTPMEILLLAILCSISVAVIAYMMVVLYRCVCSRNYAEWRASWTEKEETISKQPAFQLVMEAVPLVVTGHQHEVECLVTDGEKVVSSCLQGTIKVWDSQNGEIITKVDRSAFFKLQKQLQDKINSNKLTNYNTGVLKQLDVTPTPIESVSKLRRGLTNHLNGLRFRSHTNHDKEPLQLSVADTTKYNFARTYRDLYSSEQNDEVYVETKENIDTKNRRISLTDSIEQNKIFEFETKDSDEIRRGENEDFTLNETDRAIDSRDKDVAESPIWCLDLSNDLIILGCADGRLEFWEATSGKLMCIQWWGGGDRCSVGVTHVKALCGARRVCAASLSGHVVLYKLDANKPPLDWPLHTPTHKRTGSAGSIRNSHHRGDFTRISFSYDSELMEGEEMQCARIAFCRPHQQPISEMHCEGGRVLTGGQDHVLKVFSSVDLRPLFTLHGHYGPITSCFIDHTTPTIAGSGSQEGLLCVWDLHTGACLYSMQAHDGAVTSLAYTASYVVSAGSDERLCIWDRFQGHMLNSIHIGLNYMSRMLPLTHTLLLMADRSCLTVYDLSTGDVIRTVVLGGSDGCIYVRQILPLKDAVVCDYANQLRIVRFPLVSKLADMKSE